MKLVWEKCRKEEVLKVKLLKLNYRSIRWLQNGNQ